MPPPRGIRTRNPSKPAAADHDLELAATGTGKLIPIVSYYYDCLSHAIFRSPITTDLHLYFYLNIQKNFSL
jgi:hypothetical protein